MKINEFKSWLLQFCKILKAAEAPDAPKNLRKLLDIFNGHETITIAKFLKDAKQTSLPSEMSEPTIKTVLPTFREANKWLDNCAKQGYKNDLNLFLKFLESHESANIHALVKSVASALKPKPKSKPKAKGRNMDKAQIDELVARLTANFENEETYKAICNELAEDNNVTQLDAVAIARGIDSRTPSRASKRIAIGRVLKRFEELKKYRTKATSMAGRSAA